MMRAEGAIENEGFSGKLVYAGAVWRARGQTNMSEVEDLAAEFQSEGAEKDVDVDEIDALYDRLGSSRQTGRVSIDSRDR